MPHSVLGALNILLYLEYYYERCILIIAVLTLRKFFTLRSQAEVEGKEGFPPQPEKDLESSSLTRLQAQFPYHDSRTMTGSLSPRA